MTVKVVLSVARRHQVGEVPVGGFDTLTPEVLQVWRLDPIEHAAYPPAIALAKRVKERWNPAASTGRCRTWNNVLEQDHRGILTGR
jgi:hypothetical protein